jgi:hypothetical protein
VIADEVAQPFDQQPLFAAKIVLLPESIAFVSNQPDGLLQL